MTELSPAALAVMDAVVKVYPAFPDEVAAAALRAAADQDETLFGKHDTLVFGVRAVRTDHLLAIAAELEAK